MQRETITTLALVASLGVTGVVYASDDPNIIHACVSAATGGLRKVDHPSECRANESSVAWNVQGPEGQEGPQGEPGTPGPAGDPTVTFFALVDADGTLLSGSPNLEVARSSILDGLYTITFDQDVSLCAGVATLGSFNPPPEGEPVVPGTAFLSQPSRTQWQVSTRDSSDTRVDHDFSFVLVC